MFKKLKARVSDWLDEQQAKLDEAKARAARMDALDAEIAAREALGVAGRLELEFERYKAGDLSLEDYRDEILNEKQDMQEALSLLRSQKSLMDRDDYEDELAQIDEDKDEIRWRLDWVEKRLRDQDLHASRPGISGSGRWARFEYADADGVVTNRDVVNWEVAGRYVRAYDRKRKDERTFRIDRISDWVAG